MNGDKPRMGDSGFDNGILPALRVEPIEVSADLRYKRMGVRGLKMDLFISGRAGGDLLSALFGKQGGMPAGKSFPGHGNSAMLRSVQHHFDNTFDAPVSRDLAGNAHAQPPGNRQAYLCRIEKLSIDLV